MSTRDLRFRIERRDGVPMLIVFVLHEQAGDVVLGTFPIDEDSIHILKPGRIYLGALTLDLPELQIDPPEEP